MKFSIAFNYEYKELYIYTDFGRCFRPLYVLEYVDNKYYIQRTTFPEDVDWNTLSYGSLDTSTRNDYLQIYLSDLNKITPDVIKKIR